MLTPSTSFFRAAFTLFAPHCRQPPRGRLIRALAASAIQQQTPGSLGENQTPTTRLFIGGVSRFATEDDLRSVLTPFEKTVTGLRLKPSGGYAHVDFVDADSAKLAREALQGKIVRGRDLRPEFSSPIPPSTRQALQDANAGES